METIATLQNLPPGASFLGGILFMLDSVCFIVPTLRYRYSAALSACVWLICLSATVSIMVFLPPGFWVMQLMPLPLFIGCCAMSRDKFRTVTYLCAERHNVAFATHCLRTYLMLWLGYAGLVAAQIATVLLIVYYWRNRERNDDFFSWMNRSPVPFFIFPLYIVVVTRFLLTIALDGVSLWAYSVALSMIVMMLLASATVSYAVRQSKKAATAELQAAELQTVKKQMALHNEQIDRYAEMQGHLARLRHDIRHHNRVVSALLSAQDYEQAKHYIDDMDRELDGAQITIYCENHTVNVLLLIYAERAAALGVDFRIDAVLPVRLRMENLEVVALFSNALENALLAASNAIEPSERRMSLFASYSEAEGVLKLKVENAYSGEIRWDPNDMPISAKEGGGIGTRSIAHIVEKYDGLLSFDAHAGVFRMSALLYVPGM